MKKYAFAFIICLCFVAQAQTISHEVLTKRWPAQWITHPEAIGTEYGVYLFRKTLELTVVPKEFVVHVSADNRYRLYVNGQQVSMGPARGDLGHWHYETVDITPYLSEGKNILAAQVWNEGEFRQEVQISAKTGFILQGNTKTEHSVNTNSSWKCTKDESYSPLKASVRGYYVAGAGERRDMSLHPKNWWAQAFDDSNWKAAKRLSNGIPLNNYEMYGAADVWMLTPRTIPAMEEKVERLAAVVKVEGQASGIPRDFLFKEVNVQVPANSQVSLLLDQKHLTNAYPILKFSEGKGAELNLSYAEALYIKGDEKGNRNETEGKVFIGRKDQIISDGSKGQVFTTLNYRTYRYIKLEISTKDNPLHIHDLYGMFTGYPLEMKASLQSDHSEMNQMLDVGWRTARLCATETYMDCPYYEQLQYIGDARIQALITLYNSGDERMVKNALNLMDYSRLPSGLTSSRHPSYTPQYIPPFSLWYIGMLQDYARYGSDTDFVKNKISGSRQILSFFKNYQSLDGSLQNVPYWNFTDWVTAPGWKGGEAPASSQGESAALDFQLLMALQAGVFLERELGIPALALEYEKSITQLKNTIKSKYWVEERGLFADRAEKDLFSQHPNALAILTGTVSGPEAAELAQKLVSDTTMAQASIYFKYYLHQALVKAGFGNDYLTWLDKWRENISLGLSTWAEMSDVSSSRSDCHAWGSSPNIEFYRTVLGIDSDAVGFKKVRIEPHLGDFKSISGRMPHPAGIISASYALERGYWKIAIDLPVGINGSLIWKGKAVPLKSGRNELKLD